MKKLGLGYPQTLNWISSVKIEVGLLAKVYREATDM